jgi:hypothetical protein
MHPDVRALELAIAHGDTAEVGRLLDCRPDLLSVGFPENIGLTPLMWACRNRHTTIVELLLENGAAVNVANPVEASGDGGNTPLWFTAQGSPGGAVPLARLLLEHGAEIDARCEHGTTAFAVAVSWVHMELVQFLLSQGANPFTEDAKGRTPLQWMFESYERIRGQEIKTEDMKRFVFRAPRMIAFLEKQ